LLSLKRNTEYEQIFNPITKTMQSLLAPQAAAGDAPITAEPSPLPASSEIQQQQQQQPRRRSRGRSSKRRGSKRGFRDEEEEEEEEGLKEEKDFDMSPQSSKSSNSVYRQVLDQINPQHREKGELGLRSDGKIAGHHYEINGDVLTVYTSPTPQSFTIHDPDVWRLLLLHNVPAAATKSLKSPKVPATTTKSGKKGSSRSKKEQTTTTTTPQINPTSLESYREIILKILGDGNLSTAAAAAAAASPGPGAGRSSSLNLRQRLVNRNRPKFKLLISGRGLSKIGGGGGSGKHQQQQRVERRRRNGKKGVFLFSTEGPRRRRSNSTTTTTGAGFETATSTTRTIVIPRTNRGLLRELTLSLSELRAGNEGERETSIQLSREARRRGILPRHLLSKEEMLWSSYK
jgi:hypothetical protein